MVTKEREAGTSGEGAGARGGGERGAERPPLRRPRGGRAGAMTLAFTLMDRTNLLPKRAKNWDSEGMEIQALLYIYWESYLQNGIPRRMGYNWPNRRPNYSKSSVTASVLVVGV